MLRSCCGAKMRLHGLLAPLKQTLLLSPYCLTRASASSHFCSTSYSPGPNSGRRALSESNSNSKPPSALADDKLGSSDSSKAKGVRSRKGKPSPSLSDPTDVSSSASKPARSGKARPSTSRTKQRGKSADQPQVRAISSSKPCTSSDHHLPEEISISHYHARSSASHLEHSIVEDSRKHLERRNVIATTSCIKPRRLKRAPSEVEIAHNPRIEEDRLGAAKLRRRRKGSLAKILENGDDTNDLSVSAKMEVPSKKESNCARLKAQGVCTVTSEEITHLPRGQADVEVSAHPTKGKLSRKSSKIYANDRASAVSKNVPNASTGPYADGKYQVSNGEDRNAVAGIPKVKLTLGDYSSLKVLDVHKSDVNVQGLPNEEVTIEVRQMSDVFPMQCKVEAIGEDHDRASPTPMQESKKFSLLVAFPIKTLSRWWISCYMNSSVDVTDLTGPLRKTHFWVTAYQRAFSRMTGKYCDGEAICSVAKKLRDLQFTVARNTFEWADENHVYLPSPSTESAQTAKSFEAAFQDDVVEEVLLLVLEPIFEARFSARSHAFRPGRDAHTAIHMVRKSFQGCAWFLSGNVSSLKVISSHVLKSVVSKVRDMRVRYLLKSGLFREKWVGMKMEEVDKSSMGSSPDPSMRLKYLLWNAFLDQLDQWADARIRILSERERLTFKSSSNLFFRSAPAITKKISKMEYVRYGTHFLVGFRGSENEAETLREGFLGFLNTNMGMRLGREQLPLHHISDGVKFLDHVISQKIVYPIMHRRSASNGKTFEKRSVMIRLCLKASRESCMSYLNQIGSPASFEETKTILLILNNWYRYAEDRVKIIYYCKLCLCNLYLRKVLGEQYNLEMSKAFLKQVKQTSEDSVVEKDHGSDGAKCTSKGRVWLAEHEGNLKELAWLQNEVAMQQVVKDFRHMSTLSPQQRSARVVWDFSKGSYPLKGDYFWEAETWMHLPAGIKEGCLTDSSKSVELSECAA